MNKSLFTIAFILLSSFCLGQQGNVWTFGVGARLDFVNGVNPPNVSTSAISSYEGCASISDNLGNLLFYTDGISIFDNNDNVIQTGLSGNWSTAQSGVIVPEPGLTVGSSTNRYFIFSVPAFASERIRYTILDYSSGTPIILPSNVNLTLPDHNVAQNTCEGITVARHCNGIDYWVISHEFGNNRFKAYLVSNSGISQPVLSNIGPIATTGNNNINSACCMKLSPNNRKLAFVVRTSSVNLFDFNPSNGIINNSTTVVSGINKAYYGVEFSPNSGILYYTNILTNLYKYDILNASNQAFGNMANVNTNNLYGALQLAPNGKIYMAKDGDINLSTINQSYLGVISNPNNFATSSFAAFGQALLPNTGSKVGLPNIIPSINSEVLSISNDTLICSNQSVNLNVSGGTTYSWLPSAGLNTNIGSTVIASPVSTQTYVVSSFDTYGCAISEAITVSVDPTCCVDTLYTTNNLNVCQNELISYPDGTTEIVLSNTSQISNLLTVGGCDSIITTNITVVPNSQITQNEIICLGSDFTYPDGFISTNVITNESHISNLTSISGCDSIITTNITVVSNFQITQNEIVCSGSDFTYPDGFISTNVTTNESHISNLTSISGCDSIITTNITVIQDSQTTLNEAVCSGSNFTYPDGFISTNVTTNESHISNLTSISGCDSIITTNITVVLNFQITQNEIVCSGSDFTYPDGFISANVITNESHISNLTSISGCDSVITTNITVVSNFQITQNEIVCSGSDFTYPDGFISANVITNESHISNLTSISGCDSVITTNITVVSIFQITQNEIVCSGSDFTYPDGFISTNVTTNESHISNLTSISGCDSVITTNITVVSNFHITQNEIVCSGSNFTYSDGFISTNITTNESHISNLTSISGCDSIITTNITIIPSSQTIQNASICSGANFTYPDGFTSTNILSNESHNSVFTTNAGCDSIITINLIIKGGFVNTQQESICSGSNFTFPDGTTQSNITSNVTYNSIFQDVSGCDSIVLTILVIDQSNCHIDGTPVPTMETYNVFSPNGDGINDIFYIQTTKTISVNLQILNRWGNLIFEQTGENPIWEGKTTDGLSVTDGVYFYRFKSNNLDGSAFRGHGFVHLVR